MHDGYFDPTVEGDEPEEMFIVPGLYDIPGILRMWYSYAHNLFYIRFLGTHHATAFTGEYLQLMMPTDPVFDAITPEGQVKVKDFVSRIQWSVMSGTA